MPPNSKEDMEKIANSVIGNIENKCTLNESKQSFCISAELDYTRAMSFIENMIEKGFSVKSSIEGKTWIIAGNK